MAVVNKLQREALDEWRENPTTEWLLSVLRKGYEANRRALEANLWAEGQCDREAMGRCKAQEELIDDLMNATDEDFNGWAEHFEQKRHPSD